VTYGMPIKELKVQENDGRRTAVVDLELRQWDPTTDKWRDTSMAKHFTLPDTNLKRPNIVGFTIVGSSPGVAAWSLVATQPDQRRGRSFDVSTPGLSPGAIALSDLVVGSEAQGLTWNFHNAEIPLAPTGSVDRRTPISLYYQVKSDQARADLKITVALYRTDVSAREAALQVSFDQAVQRGINELAPTIDVSRLEKGGYRLEVRVADATGTILTRRSTNLGLE
jgi:hypothetical protein